MGDMSNSTFGPVDPSRGKTSKKKSSGADPESSGGASGEAEGDAEGAPEEPSGDS